MLSSLELLKEFKWFNPLDAANQWQYYIVFKTYHDNNGFNHNFRNKFIENFNNIVNNENFKLYLPSEYKFESYKSISYISTSFSKNSLSFTQKNICYNIYGKIIDTIDRIYIPWYKRVLLTEYSNIEITFDIINIILTKVKDLIIIYDEEKRFITIEESYESVKNTGNASFVNHLYPKYWLTFILSTDFYSMKITEFDKQFLKSNLPYSPINNKVGTKKPRKSIIESNVSTKKLIIPTQELYNIESIIPMNELNIPITVNESVDSIPTDNSKFVISINESNVSIPIDTSNVSIASNELNIFTSKDESNVSISSNKPKSKSSKRKRKFTRFNPNKMIDNNIKEDSIISSTPAIMFTTDKEKSNSIEEINLCGTSDQNVSNEIIIEESNVKDNIIDKENEIVTIEKFMNESRIEESNEAIISLNKVFNTFTNILHVPCNNKNKNDFGKNMKKLKTSDLFDSLYNYIIKNDSKYNDLDTLNGLDQIISMSCTDMDSLINNIGNKNHFNVTKPSKESIVDMYISNENSSLNESTTTSDLLNEVISQRDEIKESEIVPILSQPNQINSNNDLIQNKKSQHEVIKENIIQFEVSSLNEVKTSSDSNYVEITSQCNDSIMNNPISPQSNDNHLNFNQIKSIPSYDTANISLQSNDSIVNNVMSSQSNDINDNKDFIENNTFSSQLEETINKDNNDINTFDDKEVSLLYQNYLKEMKKYNQILILRNKIEMKQLQIEINKYLLYLNCPLKLKNNNDIVNHNDFNDIINEFNLL